MDAFCPSRYGSPGGSSYLFLNVSTSGTLVVHGIPPLSVKTNPIVLSDRTRRLLFSPKLGRVRYVIVNTEFYSARCSDIISVDALGFYSTSPHRHVCLLAG